MAIKTILDLGKHPITNSYLEKINKNNIEKEYFYDLKIDFNTRNYLISIKKKINPKKQYTNQYAHRASQSITMCSAFKLLAKKIKKKYHPKKILEIGSNDGVFIKNFSKKKVIAVEPCKNLAKFTNKLGFKTYPNFWDKKLVRRINKKFDLIYSANTISHIHDLDETFLGIYKSLSNNGIFIMEDPYMGSIIKFNSYDQFYDEHVYIFKIISLEKIIKKSNLRIFDCEQLKTHGGSMRYYICKKDSKFKKTQNFSSFKKKEISNKLHLLSTYRNFSLKVKKSKRELIKLINKLKRKNKKIISYGATYKSTTIFNYCKIDNTVIDYIVDTTKNKQGKYSPGTHIPIISPKIGMNNSVDYAFLGAWNFKKEILKKEKNFIKKGGKFITHVPHVRIISK